MAHFDSVALAPRRRPSCYEVFASASRIVSSSLQHRLSVARCRVAVVSASPLLSCRVDIALASHRSRISLASPPLSRQVSADVACHRVAVLSTSNRVASSSPSCLFCRLSRQHRVPIGLASPRHRDSASTSRLLRAAVASILRQQDSLRCVSLPSRVDFASVTRCKVITSRWHRPAAGVASPS